MTDLKPLRVPIDRDAYIRVQRAAVDVPGLVHRSPEEFATTKQAFLATRDPAADLYVFAYGSLIWNPLIAVAERVPGWLSGWHRSFCIELILGRGTVQNPGLILALDRGGSCRGVLLRVTPEDAGDAIDHLWQREMFGGSYDWRGVDVRTEAGKVRALTFVANRRHPRYRGAMDIDTTASFIARGHGEIGSCRDYLEQTIGSLAVFGINDATLSRVEAALARRDRAR
jgi:glutathione-specific gamma-glutamylcyclotransferase